MTLAGVSVRDRAEQDVCDREFWANSVPICGSRRNNSGIITCALSALILRIPYSPRTLVVDAVLGILGVFLIAVFALVRFRLWGDEDSFLGAALLVSASLPVVLHAAQRLLRPR
jgi:hypothetical protein